MSAFTAALLLLATTAVVCSGQSQRAVCTCQSNYLPVCARTNRGRANTYSNLCLAECAGSTVIHDGACVMSDCRCARVYRPVCGEDNQDYNNVCITDCLGVAVVSQGQCPRVSHTSITKRDHCPCTQEYNPVCGADGNDYDNPCMARCRGTTVARQGLCPRCICTMDFSPVCGADGQDYSNACLARCNGVVTSSRGKCDDQPRPQQLPVFPDKRGSCRCTNEFKPVCDAKGNQFNNKCLAKCDGVQEHEISAPPCLLINPLDN